MVLLYCSLLSSVIFLSMWTQRLGDLEEVMNRPCSGWKPHTLLTPSIWNPSMLMLFLLGFGLGFMSAMYGKDLMLGLWTKIKAKFGL